MALAYLLLGSNLGNKKVNLDNAKEFILHFVDKIVSKSSIYETKPWGFDHPECFYNQVIAIETHLKPDDLLKHLLQIEKHMGRVRKKAGYEARTMDIDIMLFDREIIRQEDIIVPHPLMHLRRFALVPLCEIAPKLIHPILKKEIRILLKECKDASKVVRLCR
jgi:2-amino-4-hydroxy-6-hydroxymethyldihydropteridine diphosphokinase